MKSIVRENFNSIFKFCNKMQDLKIRLYNDSKVTKQDIKEHQMRCLDYTLEVEALRLML